MPSPHPAATFAAAASAAAGLVHAAAAGSHAELTTLSRLFALAAIAQVGWAGAALVRPGRAVAFAGIATNLAVLNAWVITRGTGISFVEGLERAQPVGLQDGVAASLAVLAAVAAALSLSADPVPRLARAVAPAVAAALVVLAVPAMAQPHDHASHSHEGGHSHDAEVAGAAHDDGHEHDDHAHGPADSAATDLGYPASFASFLDQAPSPEARARAEELIIGTVSAMKAFPDEAVLQAAGFVSIGDGATGHEHYVNVERIADPAILDPAGIESVVLRVHPDGTKEVVSAMYLLPFGTTMDDAPDIAGDLTQWHDHQNLCWEGVQVVATLDASGRCQRGTFRPTQPMLHVWITDHPCGPFAGIEGSHGSGCAHDHED